MTKLFVVFIVIIVAVKLEPASSQNVCVDKVTNCKEQLKPKNYCKDSDAEIRQFFLENCPKSCGVCDDTGCKTIAGPSKNKDCIFPFVFNGTNYNKCAFDSDGFWCSTKVDSTGSHISGNWGICGSDCPKDICDSNPCMNGGICNVDGSGNYSCNCSQTNFQGVNCTDVINPCEDVSSKCTKLKKLCNKNDFVTKRCQKTCGSCDIVDCKSSPCQNGGTCIDGVDSYSCTCKQGYTGDDCETDIDDCQSSPCQNGGTCIDGVDSYNCTCKQGYTGDDCETASCNDGIMNQGETGIDCGGPCPPCLTCDDGIMNQGEIGIDCGGPCPACPTIPSKTSNNPDPSYPSTAPPRYPSTSTPAPTEEPCKDTSPKCVRFVPKYCTGNKLVMENCKASCGICRPTTKYPSTASTTEAPTTAAPTTTYPTTPTSTHPTSIQTTTNPSRRLCSARTMKKCRCGCKHAGPPEPKMKCNKKQKKNCPCKCNNL